MKSIKDSAKDNLEQNEDEILCVYDRYAGFVDGANYVLEEIEKMIPSSDDVLENHTKCKSAIFRLQSIIEQLKK